MKAELSSIGYIKSTRLDHNYELVGNDDVVFIEFDECVISDLQLAGMRNAPLAEIIFYDSHIPGQMGISVCTVVKIEGRRIYLSDCNQVNGTPVFEVKPYLNEAARACLFPRAGWINDLIKGYWYWVS